MAKIAVAKAAYHIDRPYDYLIPDDLREQVYPGVRVLVNFSNSKRSTEGLVLAVTSSSRFDNLKEIRAVAEGPVLSRKQLNLALFMREHYFCTVYDAVRAILPGGMLTGADGKRKVGDAVREIVEINRPADELRTIADSIRKRAPQQAGMLDILADFERISSKDLLLYSGASRGVLRALRDRELVSIRYQEYFRRPYVPADNQIGLPDMTADQEKAFNCLKGFALSEKFSTSLLFGVTGSGKTIIYSHLIRDCLERGKSVIFLVPEIALTPQFIREFSSYFGDRVAIIHSSLRASERYDEWKRAARGEARLIIGTRSAVFTPVQNLGLIIVDEEHEGSYKSDSSPRYDAREIAMYRCREENCGLLLGSATPDMVSMYRARTGEYNLVTLPSRYNETLLPTVRIVDMKKELQQGNATDISSVLQEELEKNILSDEQSILFLNRRGTSKTVNCISCGFTYRCPRCSVSLTYHENGDRLICHYCGFNRKADKYCPECGGILNYSGAGTQAIEAQIGGLFPDIKSIRLDADAVSQAGTHEAILKKFSDENIPVLIGTQMVGKGHNFPKVTLSAIISADQSLYSGDYRAAEKTFSLLTQVIGRSGRGEKPGRAIIQTFTPDNPVILCAADQDYEKFYDYELDFRRLQGTPPFCDLIAVVSVGKNEAAVVSCARKIRNTLEQETSADRTVRVLGPSPMPVAKVNEKYRYAVYISCMNNAKIRTVISNTIIACGMSREFKDITVYADINPS